MNTEILPIDQVTPDNIDEQITYRQMELKEQIMGDLYGASNTWRDHARERDRLQREIKQLKDRVGYEI